jgi:peptide/nickel transport system substrate-binding protein
MKSTGFLQFVVGSPIIAGVLLLSAAGATATTHPRFGGTLRVELRVSSLSLDPREWKLGSEEFAADEKMGALVFDRLVELDNYGRFQPQLANGWSHDAGFRRWVFSLRPNVRFSDGTVMNAADVAAALQPLLPEGQQITVSSGSLVFQMNLAAPDMLEELASGSFFVYRQRQDGTLIGTGPFIVSESERLTTGEDPKRVPGSDAAAISPRSGVDATKLRFRANQESWSGRPFVDAIEVTLGVPALRQLLDLQLGKADLVELTPDLVRRASRENLRVWASDPVTLYALRFDEKPSTPDDPNLREALNLSLDRATMASVLLQKQAVPASALFPQWLSGYAFLFKTEMDMTKANEIRAKLPSNAATVAEPLRLAIDSSGDLPRLLAERVAVNAREARLRLQLAPRGLNTPRNGIATKEESKSGLHLFAWRYSTLSPRLELEAFVAASLPSELPPGTASSSDPEQLFSRELKLLDDHHILPLVAVPEFVGIGQSVRDWMPAPWSEWHLADVWLDLADSGAARSSHSALEIPAPHPTGSQPGVKP